MTLPTAEKPRSKPGWDPRWVIGTLFLGIGVVELSRRHSLFAGFWILIAASMTAPVAFAIAGRRCPRKVELALLALTLALLVVGLILRWRP